MKALAIALADTGIVIIHLHGGACNWSVGGVGIRDLVAGSTLILEAVCRESGYTLIGKAATQRVDSVLAVLLASRLAVPLFLIPAGVMEL